MHVLDPLPQELPREIPPLVVSHMARLAAGGTTLVHRFCPPTFLPRDRYSISSPYASSSCCSLAVSPVRVPDLHGTVHLGPFSFLTGLFSSAVDFTRRAHGDVYRRPLIEFRAVNRRLHVDPTSLSLCADSLDRDSPRRCSASSR